MNKLSWQEAFLWKRTYVQGVIKSYFERSFQSCSVREPVSKCHENFLFVFAPRHTSDPPPRSAFVSALHDSCSGILFGSFGWTASQPLRPCGMFGNFHGRVRNLFLCVAHWTGPDRQHSCILGTKVGPAWLAGHNGVSFCFGPTVAVEVLQVVGSVRSGQSLTEHREAVFFVRL